MVVVDCNTHGTMDTDESKLTSLKCNLRLLRGNFNIYTNETVFY